MFGFVLVFAFVLLLVTFRSIVIAAKAIVLNLLSVGAAYGVLVAVFQWGWGESLLGFQSNGGIASWLPIFMFVILFGLSMDYHVFILSRVREAYDRGMTTEDAVEHGITTTAGVVSSAALVMVGAFAVFALMPILDMKEMGIGLAAAVLIDATIVRAVLLPATMKLLGDCQLVPAEVAGVAAPARARGPRRRTWPLLPQPRSSQSSFAQTRSAPALAGALRISGAGGGTRTHDTWFTKALLYQLSYSGDCSESSAAPARTAHVGQAARPPKHKGRSVSQAKPAYAQAD